MKFLFKPIPKAKIPVLIGILNIAAICFYFVVSIQFNYFENFGKTFWSSPMTGAYIRVGDFIWNGLKGSPPHGSDYRPILYPMILGMFRRLSGVVSAEQHEKELWKSINFLEKAKRLNSAKNIENKFEHSETTQDLILLRKHADELEQLILSKKKKIAYGIWVLQFIFWLSSLNLIMICIRVFTKQKLYLIFSFILFVSSISIIALTFRAITESTVIFLICLWVYLFFKFDFDNISPLKVFLLTFILSLLTILKPVFQIQLAVFLIYIVYHNYRKSKIIASLFIATTPVILQFLFMIEFHGVFSLSKIGDLTFRRYLAAKVYAIFKYNSVENKYIYEAREWTKRSGYLEILKFFIQHPRPTLIAFAQNIITENLLAPSQYAGSLIGITRSLNKIYFCLHFLFFPATLYTIYRSVGDTKLKIGYLYFCFIFIILSSGIAFYAGDRYMSTTLPLWLVIYVFVSNFFAVNSVQQRVCTIRVKPMETNLALFASIISLFLALIILVLKRIPNLTSY